MILGAREKRPSGSERQLACRQRLDQLDVRDGHHLEAADAVLTDERLELDQLGHGLQDQFAAVVATDELGMDHSIMVGTRADGTHALGSVADRARWGISGALHSQSALARPNSRPRGLVLRGQYAGPRC